MTNKMTNKIINNYKRKNFTDKFFTIPAVLSVIIFTKEFYSSNDELRGFTEDFLNKEYKDYLFKSRTLLYSRVIKDFYINNNNPDSLVHSIDNFISKETQIKTKEKGKDSQKDIIDKWRKVIDSHD